MALLPQEPRAQAGLVGTVVALAALYGFWEFWRRPNLEDLEADRARLETLENQNRAAQVRALQKERLEQQAAVYERYVRRLEELVPAEEEVPRLLRDITAEARRLGVDLNLVEPLADEPAGYYTRQAYTMRVIGEYHAVGQFLTTIASLPRIITPREVSMEPYTNQDLLEYDAGVIVDFEVETYVLPEGGPAPMPVAEEGGTGA
jgi:type IV pilus assembly protein PilO